jgi:hypothetical protein
VWNCCIQVYKNTAKDKGEVKVGMLMDGKSQLKAAYSSTVLRELWTADN